MKRIQIFILFIAGSVSVSCSHSHSLSDDARKKASASAGASASSNDGNGFESIIDTTKLKNDFKSLENLESGKLPDSNALKKTASDVLSASATLLSDSGLLKLYTHDRSAAGKTAEEMVKHYRNALGITQSKLDSLKIIAGQLAPKK